MRAMTGEDDAPAGGEDARQVVPGGWKRVLLGFAIGAAVGAAIGLVLPRDDGPHRSRG